jgi:integrase
VPLASLTPQHLQRLYTEKLAEGLAPATVNHLHAFLPRALEQGHRWGLVAPLVSAPRISKHKMRTLNPDEVRRLLEALDDDRVRALYVLAVTTGMRLGELLALRWADVNLPDQRVSVRGTLARTEGGLAVTETKTGRARLVLLTTAAAEALNRRRVAQAVERLRAGNEWADLDFVFMNEFGRPLDPSNIRLRSFRPALKRAGLPRVRFHDLRHTAATLMLGRGVHPKVVVAKWLRAVGGAEPRRLG